MVQESSTAKEVEKRTGLEGEVKELKRALVSKDA